MTGKVVQLLGGLRGITAQGSRPVWVDVGCGDGSLIMTAGDYGFAAVGLDTRPDAVSRIQGLGFNAMQHDFLQLRFEVAVDALSMINVLEHMSEPREALLKAAQVLRPGGACLRLRMPDLASSTWKMLDAAKASTLLDGTLSIATYFSRDRIIALLNECGFEVVDFVVPGQREAQQDGTSMRYGELSAIAPLAVAANPSHVDRPGFPALLPRPGRAPVRKNQTSVGDFRNMRR